MQTVSDLINELLNNGNHVEIIMLMNLKPELYNYRNNIGKLDNKGRTFTEVAISYAHENLLIKMKLTPMQICNLYINNNISSLKNLSNWDVPMQNTPIFSVILISNRDEEIKKQDIRYLLSNGYIPSQQDLNRYIKFFGKDNIYTYLALFHRKKCNIREIYKKDKYKKYLEMYSYIYKCNFSTWEMFFCKI